ncbi:hypothetical protein CI610_00378 [invertebrate metagenome]|uniref:Spore coat protein U domain-containing protein n=1 Tax=invertebrate metagenome TaxID=1711999 RepID=A0A2H9TBS4_9ZZZZ
MRAVLRRIYHGFFISLLLVCLAGTARADMSINGIVTPDIILPDGQSTVDYRITVVFKPYEGRGPNKGKFTKYRFGLADEDVTNNGSSGNIGDSARVDELSKYLLPTVIFSQANSTPSQKSFSLGYYSHDYDRGTGFDPGTNNTAFTLTGEVAVTLNADALRAKLQEDPNFKLSFWVIGQDTSGDMADSSIGAQTSPITVKTQASVKVSQLKDIALFDDRTTATMGFCVYVSQSLYEYALTGLRGKYAPAFQLKSSNGTAIHYEVAFANTLAELNAAPYREDSTYFDYIGPLNGSSDQNCAGGQTAAVGIKIPNDQLPVNDGVYTDTLTVTVEPY